MNAILSLTILSAYALCRVDALSVETIDRRKVFSCFAGSACASAPWLIGVDPVNSEDNVSIVAYDYENRDRNKNKQALIRDDYWYFTNRLPPRRFDPNVVIDDPKYNAWGSCSASGSTNSCLYVPLNQKFPAYSKYAYIIAFASKEYEKLGRLLNEIENKNLDSSSNLWAQAASFVDRGSPGDTYPSTIVDAMLKMVLFATGFLTSPNYTGPQLELLVARFYVNEANFAVSEISLSVKDGNIERAKAAWDFGRDSLNSYFALVNRAIVPKVGEKFDIIV